MSENTAEGRDFRSSIYNAETDGKMSQESVTYTNKDGNTVYAVANYKEKKGA